MPSLTLYHATPSRSSVVQWLLDEIGEPYDVHLLDLKKGDQKSPAYLAINPMGKVPALRHGDSVVTETAAICCYLADAFPAAGLAPAIGDPRRGPYLQWLFFGPSCFEPAMMEATFKREPAPPPSAAGWGSFETVLDRIGAAVAPGPFLLGQQFSAADIVIGSGLIWGTMFKAVPSRPDLDAYMDRLNARPAAQRAFGGAAAA
jgi:glutathione S-transferase